VRRGVPVLEADDVTQRETGEQGSKANGKQASLDRQ
jgi:hypothetical protein